jgi:hypothetical protein
MIKHYPFSLKKRATSKIDEEHKRSIFERMKLATTPKEKRAIITETNPLFYIFGQKCKVFKQYLTYEENFNVEID